MGSSPLHINTSRLPLVVIVDFGSVSKYLGTWSILIMFFIWVPFSSIILWTSWMNRRQISSAFSGSDQNEVCLLEIRRFLFLKLESHPVEALNSSSACTSVWSSLNKVSAFCWIKWSLTPRPFAFISNIQLFNYSSNSVYFARRPPPFKRLAFQVSTSAFNNATSSSSLLLTNPCNVSILIPFAFAKAGRPFPVTRFSYDLIVSSIVFKE